MQIPLHTYTHYGVLWGGGGVQQLQVEMKRGEGGVQRCTCVEYRSGKVENVGHFYDMWMCDRGRSCGKKLKENSMQ